MDDDALSTISSLSNTTLTDVNERQNGEIDEEIDDIYKMVICCNGSIVYYNILILKDNIILTWDYKCCKVAILNCSLQIGGGPILDSSKRPAGANTTNASSLGYPASR